MIKSIHFFHSFKELQNQYADESENLVLLVGEKTPFHFSDIPECRNTFHGVIFPEVIFEGNHYKCGIILLVLSDQEQVIFIPDMTSPSLNTISQQTKSLIVFIDGLSQNIDQFLEQMFIQTDPSLRIIGGGAGKLTLNQEAVFFNKEGIYCDAALLICTDLSIGIGVQHGWEKIRSPLIATSTEKNLLKQINYKNAYDVYKEILLEERGFHIDESNFFDIAKGFPLGIETYNSELVVRDPIHGDDNGLLLVGSIQENAVISIMQGIEEGLIDAAFAASTRAAENAEGISNHLLVIDCISRVLFLEDHFHKELEAIQKTSPHSIMFGILCLGEIANNNDRYIEFFNKTCVVGAL
jgi:hypothetical protein